MHTSAVTRVRDTCNVYVLAAGRDVVCIDFGSGAVLDRLDELGIDRITDVLVTHHHRDGVQGLARAVEHGARVWVPPVEVEMFTQARERWARRRAEDDYDVRQDRFSLLESVEIAGTVDEYRTRAYGGIEVYTLPTPGHTIGSVTYLVEDGERRLAFSGDLLYGDGKVWSLAATQWTYGGVEGQAATVLSLSILGRHEPDAILPSHGEPIEDPQPAIAHTRERVRELLELRRVGAERPWDFDGWIERPWVEVTPHLLRNRTSIATSYALLDGEGAALILDWGYDLWPGTPLGGERAMNRPLLWSIQALKRNHGVERIEAAVTTHYHDDHVAGLNLLREIEGTEVWSPANVAPVLERPERYDVPCLWFDPVRVDRVLPLGEPVAWRGYEITSHPLPGHTLYAAALEFEANGKRILATGDQQGATDDPDRDVLNYQYRNRFRIDDYVASAELYKRLRPELIVSGHWLPREVTDGYLDRLLADGKRLAELHRELLPLDEVDLGAEGFAARIVPYRATVEPGGTLRYEVEVKNPFDREAEAEIRLLVPDGWHLLPDQATTTIEPKGEARVGFEVRVPSNSVLPGGSGRAIVAADVTVDGVPFGQQAEALVHLV